MSESLSIERIDPHDDVRIKAWYDAFAHAFDAGRIDPTGWRFPEMLVAFRWPDANIERIAYGAFEGSRCVGAAFVGLSLRDNLHRANIGVGVPPDLRRRGVGTVLFEAAIEHAKGAGRTTVVSVIDLPVDAPDPWPGIAFATRHGFAWGNTEIRRQQPLPMPVDKVEALTTKAAERARGYQLVSWVGPCPDEYAEQYTHLKSLLLTEAPSGEIEVEQEVWDVERLRNEEARAQEQGRTLFTTIAVASDGVVAAHTQAAVSKHEPGRAYQWDTLVLPVHRGHRLGLAVKVANVRALQDSHPDVGRIDTWNAEQNGPMVSVNEELGYRIIEYSQEWQRHG